MVSKINEVILIGGGLSINEGISLGLKEKIIDKCVFLTNYSYKHFSGTLLCFYDKDFYVPSYAKKEPNKYPDIYKELKNLPLIIGLKRNEGIEEFKLPNTIIIPCPKKELGNPLLVGIFTLAIAEIFEPKQIFLLGFDWNRQPIPQDKTKYCPYSNLDIHYYKKEIQHRGLGWTGFYDNHNPDNYFKFFKDSKSKIYNVSLQSNINNFEKIDYTTFFNLLSDVVYNQEELRQELRKKLTT